MDIDGLRHLAQLAKLRLTEEQAQRTRRQIEQLLDAFAVLKEAPTEGIDPSPYPMELDHRLRADHPGTPLPQEEVLQNAPEQRDGCFKVPRMVDG